MNRQPVPEDQLPLINRPETILGISITFQALAWIAVFLRVASRVFLKHRAGFDDLFVVLASTGATVGSVILCLTPYKGGLGQHMNVLPYHKITNYLKFLFIANILYIAATTFIKVSILFQYLRLFTKDSHPKVRRWCIGLLIFVSIWGATFFFAATFSCTPIEKTWDLLDLVPGHCMLFGSKNIDQFYGSFTGFAASNMVIDFFVLGTPIPFWKSLSNHQKSSKALFGLLAMALGVFAISIARLAVLVEHHAGTQPTFDLTFYGPPVFVTSVLEVQVATVAASMPIFWPVIQKLGWGNILVVNEVVVTRTESQMGQHDVEAGNTSETDSLRKDEGGIAGWDDALPYEDRKPMPYRHWSTRVEKVPPPLKEIAQYAERR